MSCINCIQLNEHGFVQPAMARASLDVYKDELDDMKKKPAIDSDYIPVGLDFIFTDCVKNCDMLSEEDKKLLLYNSLFIELFEHVKMRSREGSN